MLIDSNIRVQCYNQLQSLKVILGKKDRNFTGKVYKITFYFLSLRSIISRLSQISVFQCIGCVPMMGLDLVLSYLIQQMVAYLLSYLLSMIYMIGSSYPPLCKHCGQWLITNKNVTPIVLHVGHTHASVCHLHIETLLVDGLGTRTFPSTHSNIQEDVDLCCKTYTMYSSICIHNSTY